MNLGSLFHNSGESLGCGFFYTFAAMNWLILIFAVLCETGFAFCLSKTKFLLLDLKLLENKKRI